MKKSFNNMLLEDGLNNKPRSLLFFVIPFAVLLVLILIMFKQQPNSILNAFTQTSDWTFSQQISPPPIQDGHYLCTVAAKGHKNIVKPLRYGSRHGHRVIVNRQLLVANAFEELITEKFPKTHKFIRTNYDKYGYPLSKHINTEWSADLIYILMKPFEIIFLFVLYLFSNHPEERISKQYILEE